MIMDQTISSARAEGYGSHVGQRVIVNLLAALLALALVLASLTNLAVEGWSKEAAVRPNATLPLPPIPYLDSIPWMKWNASAPTLRIDTLMSPSVTPWGVLQTPQDRAKASPTFG